MADETEKPGYRRTVAKLSRDLVVLVSVVVLMFLVAVGIIYVIFSGRNLDERGSHKPLHSYLIKTTDAENPGQATAVIWSFSEGAPIPSNQQFPVQIGGIEGAVREAEKALAGLEGNRELLQYSDSI